MELNLVPGKSWKINQMVATFLICVRFAKFWTPHFSVLSFTLFRFNSTFWLDSMLKLNYVHKVIDLVHVYENLTCSIYTQFNSPGKTWKMDINGPGKSWKTHIERSWKVMENHFQCSVHTLFSPILVIFCKISS